ncbi:MAG: hypothetical protein KKF33_18050 [Alphaproteobacteria bacterium]|nr:hypothetical protein [Alphaproteobacteria bacterium]
MILPIVTDLLSRIGEVTPDLLQSRDGQLLTEALIAEAKAEDARKPVERAPIAPVDLDRH